MVRARLIWLILTGYSALAVLAGFWGLKAWSVSAPVVQAAVLGVSTDPTVSKPDAAAPTLGTRPVFSAPAGFKVAASQAVLYDQESGRPLYSQGLHQAPIASTTKMMSSLVAATKLPNLDAVTTVSTSAAGQVPSRMELYAGERISIRALLNGMLLVSGNDASHAVAEYVGGLLLNNPSAPTDAKLARFVEEMNATAAQLHMENTHYEDPAGLNDSGHSTALDLAKLAGPFTAQPVLAGIISQPTANVSDANGQVFHEVNSDRLVQADSPTAYLPGILGGKTGYTPHDSENSGAGHCLVATARRNGHTLTAVIMNTTDDSNEASWVEAKKLLETGYANTVWK